MASLRSKASSPPARSTFRPTARSALRAVPARMREPSAGLDLKVANANIRSPRPAPAGRPAELLPASVNARLALADGTLRLTDLKGTVAGTSIGGRLAVGTAAAADRPSMATSRSARWICRRQSPWRSESRHRAPAQALGTIGMGVRTAVRSGIGRPNRSSSRVPSPERAGRAQIGARHADAEACWRAMSAACFASVSRSLPCRRSTAASPAGASPAI